jgi:hypothetical protein
MVMPLKTQIASCLVVHQEAVITKACGIPSRSISSLPFLPHSTWTWFLQCTSKRWNIFSTWPQLNPQNSNRTFEIFAIFWHIAPCSLYVNRRFSGTYYLHLQGRKSAQQENSVYQVASYVNITTAVSTSNSTHLAYSEQEMLSRWLCSVRHEISSSARILGSWVLVPPQQPPTGWSPPKEP